MVTRRALTDDYCKRRIRSLATAGLSQRKVREQLGLGTSRFYRLVGGMKELAWRQYEPTEETVVQQAERLHGRHLAELIEDLADEGLSMRQAADRLGLNRESLRVFVKTLPRSPWLPNEVARTWLKKTGETIPAAARRLAETHTLAEAARIIGYRDGASLRRALLARGAEVKFLKRDKSAIGPGWLWQQRTGEPMAVAAERLGRLHTAEEAAAIIGYANGRSLRNALCAKGLRVKFQKPKKESRDGRVR